MIGSRTAVSAGSAVLGLALVLGPRAADPSAGLAAERLVRERSAAAISALDALLAASQPGLEAARAASAAVLSGDEPPGPGLEAAAALVEEAERAVAPARRAVASLSTARIARDPSARPLPPPIEIGELSSIAGQLARSGPAADAFADLRLRATRLPGLLEQVLRGLQRGDLGAAAELTERARADLDAVVAWETDLPTLPVWIETTDAMISAVEQILDATRAGDDAAATEAADAFAALSDEAATADRALRIALSEGGASLTAAPLERLASALRAIEGSRAAAAASLAETGG